MPKRLTDLSAADALNSGDDLVYIRQASGSRRDRKITTKQLFTESYSDIGGVTAPWDPEDEMPLPVLVWRRAAGVLVHGWLDLTEWLRSRLATVDSSIAAEKLQRELTDNELSLALAAEATARESADTNLDAAITAAGDSVDLYGHGQAIGVFSTGVAVPDFTIAHVGTSHVRVRRHSARSFSFEGRLDLREHEDATAISNDYVRFAYAEHDPITGVPVFPEGWWAELVSRFQYEIDSVGSTAHCPAIICSTLPVIPTHRISGWASIGIETMDGEPHLVVTFWTSAQVHWDGILGGDSGVQEQRCILHFSGIFL